MINVPHPVSTNVPLPVSTSEGMFVHHAQSHHYDLESHAGLLQTTVIGGHVYMQADTIFLIGPKQLYFVDILSAS